MVSGVQPVDGRQSLWSPSQYSLLDFGAGRKLERFGDLVLSRPCPAAAHLSRDTQVDWRAADIVTNPQGELLAGKQPTVSWKVRFEAVVFQLKLTPFGHVGVFPEQAENWIWLDERVRAIQQEKSRPAKALNLFAYTGGSTLTMSAAGAEVVHVDASAPTVKWARENAQLSGLSDQPIRWIVEDARRFVAREQRRSKRYDLIVLDPPSYGHGPSGTAWNIDRDLEPLLLDCIGILAESPSVLLLTAHSDTWTPRRTAHWLSEHLDGKSEQRRLSLISAGGRALDAGFLVRMLR